MNRRNEATRITASLVLLGGLSIALAGATAWPALAAATTPTPPDVVVTTNVAYESDNPILVPGELDVFAPSEAGPWPVVVMLHGAPSTTSERVNLRPHAYRVADLGFVVFNADWGRAHVGDIGDPTYDDLLAANAQAACAVEFARAHAADYGGNPQTMIVFGHSGGAHPAAMLAFGQADPSAGCLGNATLGDIDALVTWEGNFLLSVNYPDWDGALAADPRILDVVTPWAHIAERPDRQVVMLVSERPGASFEREVGDPWAADSWLAVRDPSGDLRRQLEADGAFADGILDFTEVQQILYSVLEANGNPVSLDVMPNSTHTSLGDAGWEVFLTAFQKAAAED